ncbi:biotin--[acetyl-CoA-carboxylase] ligase [Kordiimonas marina]|uniref:biotin--[acetyl-CoA-carboxylase] ligase n=1 Tax=Kordiimonas marina TaxID=2872312 RepID=UPI001FF67C41|nr:biotin--[acetyl-CoA-carboxylase] ligase [Kordiimonas marina]MCJ9428739.1 biotin--[acetyl-CoA-carboxylase] ligase [Kordiimonas marina]
MPHGVGARFFEVCSSTNRLASDAALEGLQGPCWFIGGAQEAGRGRRGRAWTSEPGNLYASLLFRPSLKPADMAALPFICALAVRDTFIALGADADTVRCKWPNDVLISGKKASGILIESSARNADALDFVVIGIGMNLAHFPADALFPATSLATEIGQAVPVQDAASHLARILYDRLNAWNVADFAAIAREWTEVAWGLGCPVTLRTTGETFTGTPVRLEADGALLVTLDGGHEKRLYAGDVFPVNTAEQEGNEDASHH